MLVSILFILTDKNSLIRVTFYKFSEYKEALDISQTYYYYIKIEINILTNLDKSCWSS